MHGATALRAATLLVPLLAGLAALPPASAAPVLRYTGTRRVWPGVVFHTFHASGPGGLVTGDLLDADLGDPHVTVDLLHPPTVAAREPVSRMVAARHAVAGVNGDFFNISERHAGVRPTGSAVGPEVAGGRALKAAVPDAQRFGPAPPSGTTTEDVIGVGTDRTARMTALRLTGTIDVHGPLAPVSGPPTPPPPDKTPPAPPTMPPTTPPTTPPTAPPTRPTAAPPAPRPTPAAGRPEDPPSTRPADDPFPGSSPFRPAGFLATGSLFSPADDLARQNGIEERAAQRSGAAPSGRLQIALRGLNQYALPVGGVGVFTSRWGAASRVRAVCGSDVRRKDPCATETTEVTVRHDVVTRVGATVGAGAIAADTTMMVGREAGAATLRRLRPGDHVRVTYRLAGAEHLRFAVGGFPILRGGAPLPGLNAGVRAARTAAGVSRNGRHLFLLVADRRSGHSTGLTLAGLAALLRRVGAHGAVNLDGGGSSTFVLRVPGDPAASVRNVPSAGAERAVANGIGIFARP